jgi:predicted O-linked N-acetylglucosamine transferase (SPINDLY family)
MGRSFASRVGASLVRAAGLPELVAESPAAYEMLAVDLAKNPERAMALKKKLMAHRLTCSLFDLGQFTRHIEDAYAQMSARYHEGQRPEHLVITA